MRAHHAAEASVGGHGELFGLVFVPQRHRHEDVAPVTRVSESSTNLRGGSDALALSLLLVVVVVRTRCLYCCSLWLI